MLTLKHSIRVLKEILMLDVGQLELNFVVVQNGAPILDNNNNVYPKHCKIITKFIRVH